MGLVVGLEWELSIQGAGLECGYLVRVAAAGLLNLSGPFWPPPLPLSLMWPEMGPPILSIS